jgi:hypothetical protein
VTLRDAAAEGKKNGWVRGGHVGGGRGFEDIRKKVTLKGQVKPFASTF